MADVIVPVTKFGSAQTWVVANATDTFLMPNDGLTKLYVENGTPSNVIATFHEQRPCNYHHPEQDFLFTCPGAGTISRIGTFRKDRYNRDDGRVEVTLSISGAGTVRLAGVYDELEDGRI